ncbi:MAG: tRNA (adenosine(37)-N6)-dimethylallyltransferase MiaA, partial [Elusimicrobiota bacterium]|nr:tRNA (adenosine(37)-N6)-dimethylallyltransferase MiaA [Elusimicrobiota bacterium]
DGIPYYLVDFLDIKENFDASKFCSMSDALIAAQPRRQFIFAGGTGLYLQAYFAGMDNLPPADAKIRAELARQAEEYGKEYLHKRLAAVDAQSAARIPAGNIQRVMRALEIFLITGAPASRLRTGANGAQIPPSKAHFFYLNWDKEILNRRITRRTEEIFEPMLAEARAALAAGCPQEIPGLKSLGYREAIACLNGTMTKASALERIIILTRQYAKRQRTWFARYKDMIRIDLDESFDPQQTARDILGRL